MKILIIYRMEIIVEIIVFKFGKFLGINNLRGQLFSYKSFEEGLNNKSYN